ncbi:hypothetical protein GJ744_010012 [Endocarpon pusillum]|uniref:Ankyrin n=1 Tax=Endocarpon pusillum TaxID=364733 RepID=A0A8H7AF82_9EURO|nr:hypothetical protein GJ744_010012 [Endocarpon pusillum]
MSTEPANKYALTDSDLEELPVEQLNYHPLLRAAVNPNSRVLSALLSLADAKFDASTYIPPNATFSYDSALLAAVRAGLKTNVEILLAHGADPNGLPIEALSHWGGRFLRFRPHLSTTDRRTREDVLRNLPTAQTVPFTVEELNDRKGKRARFWAEHDFPPDSGLLQPALTALEAASLAGDISIVDSLLAAGADTSAWKQQYDSMPSQPSLSYLATSTPLHRAVESKHLPVVQHLLDLGFAADVFPLAAITRCVNPLMASLMTEPPHLEAYHLLASSQHADHSLCTPIFNVHILHIAVATLSLPAVRSVAGHADPPNTLSINPTGLGHTLLHIACLPFDDDHINHFSPKTHESIHELRTLSSTYRTKLLWPHKPRTQPMPGRPRFPEFPTTDHWPAQLQLVEFLLENGRVEEEVSSRDVHGNTPLHYLAGHWLPHHALIDKLKHTGPAGEAVWTDSRNAWGYTPQDLYDDGKAALEALRDNNGKSERDVTYMPHWKDPMGAWIMGRWVSSY